MINENLQKVHAAIRAGKFTQGFGLLYKDGCHCYLGCIEQSYIDEVKPKDKLPIIGKVQISRETASWVGFNGLIGGYYDEHGFKGYLDELNDIEKLTLTQIADFVETEPKGLLKESDV